MIFIYSFIYFGFISIYLLGKKIKNETITFKNWMSIIGWPIILPIILIVLLFSKKLRDILKKEWEKE